MLDLGQVSSSCLDAIYYESAGDANDVGGCQTHEDKGLLTILFADNQAGLQVTKQHCGCHSDSMMAPQVTKREHQLCSITGDSPKAATRPKCYHSIWMCGSIAWVHIGESFLWHL